MARKAFVTGADGFIGSHLTESLVRDGWDVKALACYNSFNSWGWLEDVADDVKGNFEVVSGDIRDPFFVRTHSEGIDTIFHLAALIAIPFSYVAPQSYVETNITGTVNVLEAARAMNVGRVIHTSTSETYGTALFVPITEEHPMQGQSPYSASKIGADQIALSYNRSFDLDVGVIRPFNTYGPRQSARAVIPTIITQLLSGQKKIKLGALSPTRDFNFVEDTANGFKAFADGPVAGEVINVGSGYEISIGDTAQLIADVIGVDVEIECDEERIRPEKSEVNRLWACNKRAKEILGWEPQYGSLEGFRKGLEISVEWFRKPENLARYKAEIYNV